MKNVTRATTAGPAYLDLKAMAKAESGLTDELIPRRHQPAPHDDGLVFDSDSATAEVIRDDDEYSGERVSMGVELARARTRFHIDINIGDPVWPAPGQVEIRRLLGGQPLHLLGYPLVMVHAEEVVTAVQRGTANTRWRDFGDIWTLSGRTPWTRTPCKARSSRSPPTAAPTCQRCGKFSTAS